VYDGHGGAEVAQHAAAKLHQHFQAAYKQLSTAAQLAGAGSGSACSASSSVTLEEMLCDPWHSSSSSSNSLTSDSTNSSGGTLADVLVSIASGLHQAGPAAAAADLLSCSSPSSTASSNGGSPTCQQVWDTLNSPTAGALLPAAGSASLRHKQLKQHQQQQAQAQQPSRASRVVVQALREAFLRTDADLAGTEVGEVVGTTAVTAVMSEGELFIGHCGELWCRIFGLSVLLLLLCADDHMCLLLWYSLLALEHLLSASPAQCSSLQRSQACFVLTHPFLLPPLSGAAHL
jgi:serine/threonine protein phosphatase PrpC